MTTLREAAKMALDALEHLQTDIEWQYKSPTRAMLRKVEKALRAALAQPEQEPRRVRMERADESKATQWWNEAARIKMPSPDLYAIGDTILCWVNEGDYWAQMHTAPPQREWQGLTDEEIMDECSAVWASHPIEVGRVIEAKLKEKNS